MIIREAAWVALGQAIVVIAGLVGIRLLTTLLPPAVYGQVSLVIGLGALGMGVLCIPFLQASLREFPQARDAGRIDTLRRLTARYLRRSVGGIAAALLVAGLVWEWWQGASLPFTVFVAAGALVACDAWRSFEQGFLNGARRQKDYALRSALDAIARPLTASLLVWWLGPLALNVVAGFAAGAASVGLLLRNRVVRGDEGAAPRGLDDDWAREHAAGFLKFALPLIPLCALNWVMSMGDRYVLAASWGPEVVGIYWAAYALGSQPFIAVNGLVHTTLRPVLYDAVARRDHAKERRTLRVWIPLVLAIAFTGWLLATLLAEPVCDLILGAGYAGAAELLPWIAAAYAVQMIQQSFEIILFAHGRSKQLVLLQAVAAVVAVVLYLLLIPELGGLGAALGTLGAMTVTMLVACFLSGAPRKLFGPLPAAA